MMTTLRRRPEYRRRQDSGSRDSGAEVSEDEVEEVGGCEGSRLVELMMTTLRNTCSLLLLSHNTDVKNVSHFVSLLSLCLSRQCYQHHHKQLLLSWKHKLVSIWGSGVNLHHQQQPGSHKKGKYQEERGGGRRFGSTPFHSFPISHWT